MKAYSEYYVVSLPVSINNIVAYLNENIKIKNEKKTK